MGKLPPEKRGLVDPDIFTDYCKQDPVKEAIAQALIKEGKIILRTSQSS